MATDGSEQNVDLWPLPAFYFSVSFGEEGVDAAFQEVSGIGSQIETEDYLEGGENRYIYHLPKSVKHSNLVLKRGIADLDSKLVKWCQSFFNQDFNKTLEPKDVQVHLLDQEGDPVRSWSFTMAFPVNWKVDSFLSTKNEAAIEEIELSFQNVKRTK